MKVLVLGPGAREHALAWKINQSPICEQVWLHPGNAGSRKEFDSFLDIRIEDVEGLVSQARKKGVELVVIGPEGLLSKGFADAFRMAGFKVVGPSKEAAQLESSKAFAKDFMKRAGIPTAHYEVAQNRSDLKAIAASRRFPFVLKLDGLAAGKGVVIAQSQADVDEFCAQVWDTARFGPGPHQIVIEDCLKGREMSYIGLCDGSHFIPLPTATDYKRVRNKDEGPNTGGMGCISPSPFLTPALETTINKEIIEKLLSQLEKEKIEYRGALYVGLMVDDAGNANVLEFNARFGDPETQATLLRIESDFLEALLHTAEGRLSFTDRLTVSSQSSIYVVGAAKGYPENVETGDAIEIGPLDKAQLFFAGVKQNGQGLVTAGGRVLGIGVLADSPQSGRDSVYANLENIKWKGMHFRNDIGEYYG